MKPHEISEFSYGYAVTEELIHWRGSDLTAAPIFPSLRAEGQPEAGYDLMLDQPSRPLFLQFKLSEYMKGLRRNVPEVRHEIFSKPFYRMHLTPLQRSDQHKHLCELEDRGNDVFYTAPLFHKRDNFNDYYLTHDVVEKSIWLSPLEIGSLPDDGPHHLSFQNDTVAWLFSEPKKIKAHHSFKTLAERFSSALRNPDLAFKSVGQWINLRDNLWDVLKPINGRLKFDEGEDLDLLAQRKDTSRLMWQISYLSKVLLGCEVFAVRYKEKSLQADSEENQGMRVR